jgi:hypothetical protein
VADDIRKLLDHITQGDFTPEQLRELRRTLMEAEFARREDRGELGTPGDTAVQKLAADRLKELRDMKPLPRVPPGGFSYRQIGEMYGVSAERVRKIYAKLAPFEYDAERRERRAAG